MGTDTGPRFRKSLGEDGEMEDEEPEEDVFPCDLCGKSPEEVLIEDLSVCRQCETRARSIIWQRRYR